MDSLSDRLKSLGFTPAAAIQKPSPKGKLALEDAIEGVEITNSAGAFVVKEQLFPLNYQHGKVRLVGELDTETIQQSARIDFTPDALNRMIFIDTETSGLSGGTGTFAFLIGVGFFKNEGFFLQQLVIRDPTEELAMLVHLSEFVGSDSIFVSYNGKSFDIPLLQNRFILNKLPGRYRDLAHVDLLHISRKLWRKTLPSCTLKEIEVSVLGFNRSSEDVPGWMIPDIYYEYLRNRDPSKLTDVIYHNAQDIVSLAALMIHIADVLALDQTFEGITTNDLTAISQLYWDLGAYDISAGILNRCLGRKLNREQTSLIHSSLGRYYKMMEDWEQAAFNWEKAASSEDPYAMIELAKYFEHKARDIVSALTWSEACKTLLETNKSANLPAGFRKDLEKRISRLQQKGLRNVQ